MYSDRESVRKKCHQFGNSTRRRRGDRPSRRRLFAKLSSGAIFGSLFGYPLWASAATNTYTTLFTAGNWSQANAWSLGHTPQATEDAQIIDPDTGVPRTITYDYTGAAVVLNSVTIDLTGAGSDILTLSMSANNLSAASETFGLNGRGTMSQTGGTNGNGSATIIIGSAAGSSGTYILDGTAVMSAMHETVGSAGSGLFTQNAGQNTTTTLVLGELAGGSGTYDLVGGSLSTSVGESVGETGSGSFSQMGGTNSAGALDVGQGTGGGSYTLGGATSQLTAVAEHIGDGSDGSFTQNNGGNTITNGVAELDLGETNNVTGNYDLDGGTLTVHKLFVGGSSASGHGVGVLTVDGGTLNMRSQDTLKVYTTSIGANFSALNLESGTINTGFLTIPAFLFHWSGGTLDLTNQNVSVQNSGGAGTLGTGSNSAMTLGSGMTLTLSNSLYIGGSSSTTGTTGVLSVSGGATINIGTAKTLKVWNSAGSGMNFSGGTINTGTLDLSGNTGLLNWTGGTLNLTHSGATFDGSASATLPNNQTIASGMALFVDGTEYVGFNADGTLNQSGGTNGINDGDNFGYSLYVGYGAGHTGNYNLNGTGTLNNTGSEFIGASGTGNFTQISGTNTILNIDQQLSIAQNSGSSGTYALIGGSLRIPHAYIGGSSAGAGGAGVLTVSGSGSLTATQDITVYNTAGAAFNVQGGAVTAPTLHLRGSYTQSDGAATFGQITNDGGGGSISLSGGQMNLTQDVQSPVGAVVVSGPATLGFDVGTSGASEIVASTASFTAAPDLAFTLSGFPAGGSVFTLLTSPALSDNGNLNGLASQAVTIGRETLTPSLTGGSGGTGSIIVTVSGGPANLTWIGDSGIYGDGGGSWDNQIVQNWNNQGTLSRDYFYTGDNVTFDDSGNGTVDIYSGDVTPGAVTFNNSQVFNGSGVNYTVNGGAIAGPTGLTVAGSGNVTLNNGNTYLGPTGITGGGTLTLVGSNASPTFNVTHGTLQLANSSLLNSGAVVNIGDSGTLDLDGNFNAVGGLTGATNSVVTNTGFNIATLVYGGGDSTFNGVIEDDGQVALQVNSGTLTLTNANNNYSGGTTIQGGAMAVTGSLSTTGSVNVEGGTLAGNTAPGNGVGNVTLYSGNISPGTGAVPLGTLNLTSLTVIDGNLQYVLGAGNASGLLDVTNTADFEGSSTITVGAASVGTYTLLTSSSLQGSEPTLIAPTSASLSYTLDFDQNLNEILLDVNPIGPANLTWDGQADQTTWDISTTGNWNDGMNPAALYLEGANVTFDDTAPTTATSVALNTTVSPLSTTVNSATNNYTIIGTGSIAGSGSLTLSGGGTLTIATDNSYSGGTIINAGTLQVGNGGSTGSLGSGNVTDNGALAFDHADNGFTVANNIGGTGSVSQIGSGTTTLTGNNTYGGGTTISAGTLAIGAVGALPTGGAVANSSFLTINANSTAGDVSGTGATTVAAGVSFTAANFTQAALANLGNTTITGSGATGPISGNGSLTIGVDGSSTNTLALTVGSGASTLGSLTLLGNASLDVNNNHMFISYGTSADPATTIRAYLTSGINGGHWNGTGLISTSAHNQNTTAGLKYALGYADSADAGIHPAGLPANTIEIKYTLVGDLDLNGVVNGTDFARLSQNFGHVFRQWDQGDLDYNNVVNGSDFADLSANFGHSDAGAAVALSASDWAAFDAFAADHGLTAAVPEPTAAGLLGIAAAGVLARRRRHQYPAL